MRKRVPFIAALLFASQAHADFALLPQDTSPVPAPAAAATALPINVHPDIKPGASHLSAAAAKVRHANTSSPKNRLAEGFGNQIPLSFAVRQIVPPTLKVAFSPGANQSSLVDWTGGRPWPAVLRGVLRPLRLRLAIQKNKITISQ